MRKRGDTQGEAGGWFSLFGCSWQNHLTDAL